MLLPLVKPEDRSRPSSCSPPPSFCSNTWELDVNSGTMDSGMMRFDLREFLARLIWRIRESCAASRVENYPRRGSLAACMEFKGFTCTGHLQTRSIESLRRCSICLLHTVFCIDQLHRIVMAKKIDPKRCVPSPTSLILLAIESAETDGVRFNRFCTVDEVATQRKKA